MTSPQLNSYEDRSLYTTWQLSFDRIEKQNKLSAKLLRLWAYFDRQDVWFELLRHGNSADFDWISQLTEDEMSFSEAIRVLCNYGLVDADLSSHEQMGSRGYSVHSCVHSWTIYMLNKEWDKGLARLALDCTASEVPAENADNWWLIQRRLLPHAARCAYLIVNDQVRTEGIESSVHSLGDLYMGQGKLTEAEKMYLRALQGKEEALGPKHTSTLDTVNNLGILYRDQGKLPEAEEMYKRALQGCEEALGPKHISTLVTVHNLGSLYTDQGKLTEAEKMYLRALQGYEEAL
jgi:tetratricopeptide (TPR) repeat protein